MTRAYRYVNAACWLWAAINVIAILGVLRPYLLAAVVG